MSYEDLMRRALTLAERGLGRTTPNPAVGALIVAVGVLAWFYVGGKLGT